MAMTVNRFCLKACFLALCIILVQACYPARHLSVSSSEPRTWVSDTSAICRQLWTFSQTHPDGFTLEISTMQEPSTGICAAYAATQDSHGRDQLGAVVRHALEHGGFVGGWRDPDDGKYYFDSVRVFPEDSLAAATRFGIENGQIAVFFLSTGTTIQLPQGPAGQ